MRRPYRGRLGLAEGDLGSRDLADVRFWPVTSDSRRLLAESGVPLGWIEEELWRAVASDNRFMSDVAAHLVNAGGQRWRPSLSVLSAMAGGAAATGAIVKGACSVELIHLGSLYHDDVMDEAETRRGVESVNARWGNLVAILAGDYLLARASEIGASLGSEVAGLLARTITRLCEGQVAELELVYQPDRPEESYFRSIEGKTAALFSTACRVGGLCGQLSLEQVEALAAYGAAFGVTFQIVDDIRDFVASETELGKPAGHDLLEGVYTLPVIRALQIDEVADELRPLLGAGISRPDADKAIAIVRECGAVRASAEVAVRWAETAAEALSPLGAGDVQSRLAGLARGLASNVLADCD